MLHILIQNGINKQFYEPKMKIMRTGGIFY